MTRLTRLLFVLAVTGSSTAALGGVAHADAYGVDKCDSVAGGDRPSCVFEHGITGQGLKISEQFAEAEGFPATLCNTRIDFQYLDVNGQVYRTIPSPGTRSGCTAVESRTIRPGGTFRQGKACAVLYSNSAEIARQCHNIFP